MQVKEEKICSFTQNGTRLQLVKINRFDRGIFRYQVRLNRKIIDTSISEYQMRKVFATYCQNIVLQLKIYDNTTPTQNNYEQIKKNNELVILDYSKVYGWNVKYTISEEEAKRLIKEEQLIEDKDNYIPTWFTKQRWESTIKPMRERERR